MSGLLKTLIKPDWDDNPKRSEILHAANLLQIGEFQLIQKPGFGIIKLLEILDALLLIRGGKQKLEEY